MSCFHSVILTSGIVWLAMLTCGIPTLPAQSPDDFGRYRRIEAHQTASPGSTSSLGNPREVILDKCGAHLIDEIELAALVNGQLETIRVERGANIRAGEIIAQIDNTLARIAVEESQARLELANFQATDEIPIQAAFKEIQLRKTQFDKIVEPWLRKSIPEFEYLERKFQLEIAELKHSNAMNQQKLAEIEAKAEQAKLDAAQEQMKRHALIAPFDGQVFEIIKQRGEWVNAGEPVFRLARLDRVRIRGSVKYSEYDPHELAERPVMVSIPMARGRRVELPGQVVFVASERVADTFEVLAEVENRQENGHWVISARHTDIIMRIQLQP